MTTKTRLPTVLVVDDEVRSQEALRRTLEEELGFGEQWNQKPT